MVMQNIINFLEYYFYLFLFLYYTIISILIIWIINNLNTTFAKARTKLAEYIIRHVFILTNSWINNSFDFLGF